MDVYTYTHKNFKSFKNQFYICSECMNTKCKEFLTFLITLHIYVFKFIL